MAGVRSQRGLYEGFGNANTRAFELVLIPLLFALLGFALSRNVAVTVGFGVFGLVGTLIKAFYEYKAAMAKQEEGMPWATKGAPK